MFQASSVVIWILVATGFCQSLGLMQESTLGLPLFGLLIGLIGGACILAPKAIRDSQSAGLLFAVGALFSQLLLTGQQAVSPLAMGALFVVVLPFLNPKLGRVHIGIAGLVQFTAPLATQILGLWGTTPSQDSSVPTLLIHAAAWTGLALLVFEIQQRQPKPQPLPSQAANPSPAGLKVVGAPVSAPKSPEASGLPPAAAARPGSGASSSMVRPASLRHDEELGSESDPSATQLISRHALQSQDREEQAQISQLLEPVVLLMFKIFKPHSALGFLYDPETKVFRVNAFQGKGKVIPDVEIIPGQGVIGSVVSRPMGFTTGDVSRLGKPEYSQENEWIASLMAIPVRNEVSREIQALLVVDSQQGRAFPDNYIEWLRLFRDVASALVTVQHARNALSRQATTNKTFYDIQSQLARHLKTEDILHVLDQALMSLFEYDRMLFISGSNSRQIGQVFHVAGTAHGLDRGAMFSFAPPIHSFYGDVFRNRERKMIENLSSSGQQLFAPDLDKKLSRLPECVISAPLFSDDGNCIGVVGVEGKPGVRYSSEDLMLLASIASIASNAISRAQMYQKMERLATIDGLTQIPNHRHFQDLLSQQLDIAARYGHTLGLLLFDIDHFKNFNDTYGHPVGDQVLKAVAKAVQAAVRSSDMVARYGGEEFVVLIPQTDAERALQSAERVRMAVEALELPHESGKKLRVTISIGVCTFPNLANAKQELIDGADKAMYYSKKTGRNRVTLYGPHAEQLAQQKEASGGGGSH